MQLIIRKWSKIFDRTNFIELHSKREARHEKILMRFQELKPPRHAHLCEFFTMAKVKSMDFGSKSPVTYFSGLTFPGRLSFTLLRAFLFSFSLEHISMLTDYTIGSVRF